MTAPPNFPALSLAAAHAALTAPGSPFEIEERDIRGVRTRVWKNAPPTLREAFAAGRQHKDKTFIVYRDERVTFEALARASLAVADALQAQGLQKGDRVAIAMRNMPEWAAAFFGTVVAGGVAALLNAWWKGGELEYGLIDSGATFAFADGERLERLGGHLDHCGALRRIFVCRPSGGGAPRLAQPLAEIVGGVEDWSALPDRPLPSVALAPDDDATIFYTSGTTGKPKGALGTHRNSCSTIMASVFTPLRAMLRRGEAPPQPNPNAPQKAALVGIPLFHTTGCQAGLIPAFVHGTKLVLMHKWDAELALQLIERERVTSTGGVPTIAWQIVEHPSLERYDLSSLETVSYGGAPAASELVRRIKQKFPKSSPGCGWGMSETSATFTSHVGEDYELRPDSCGPALPVCEMKIVDAMGRVLPAGEVGELWVKGPNVVKGYWRNPEATAATFVDGWLRTGDIARLDEEGFCFIVDRAKDMLIRGGENIYCVEVENALFEHPAVIDAAVVPIPHRTLGEEPGAVVTLKAGAKASEEEMRAFVGERIAAFKVPVRILFSQDMLPRNAAGKIMKAELKALFAGGEPLLPAKRGEGGRAAAG
ncbi:MAG TPA: class I adenylate-forming enzyme family protein [Roseiarcus sp.]|nr:class I adenylate-forming enzyme family protein [Roseiarcus sp.]